MRIESELVSITRQPVQATLETMMWAIFSVIVLLAGSTMAVVGPPEHDPGNAAAQVQLKEPLVAKTAEKPELNM